MSSRTDGKYYSSIDDFENHMNAIADKAGSSGDKIVEQMAAVSGYVSQAKSSCSGAT